MIRIPMTATGASILKNELEHLKKEVRPQIIAAIAEAREHGDLKENADYQAAKEQQAFAEGRIKEIESKLAQAQVIDIDSLPKDGKIVFGVIVNLAKLDDDTEVTYQIVGDDEADIKAMKVAISSPIARALIGKYEGDVAIVNAPNGDIEYEVVSVHYK